VTCDIRIHYYLSLPDLKGYYDPWCCYMKILHIAGWSGSGKTTFIRKLLPFLSVHGKTGTIKHICSHYSVLPPGKDTSIHFEAGSNPSVGIDNEKTIAYFHCTDLETTMDMLSDSGVRYAVIEGYKNYPFQKILIGDLEVDYLLKNPAVDEVIPVLDQFDDWYTLSGLSRELITQYPGSFLLTWTGYTDNYLSAFRLCSDIEQEFSRHRDVCGIRIRVHRWVKNNLFPVYMVMAYTNTGGSLLPDILNQLYPCISDRVS